jgi:hypothetical protein
MLAKFYSLNRSEVTFLYLVHQKPVSWQVLTVSLCFFSRVGKATYCRLFLVQVVPQLRGRYR